MSAILKVENLSKRYYIGEVQERGARHALERALRNPMSLFKTAQAQEFWALKDLNFELHEGQKLGIIGRNGAGKSTLLKLISRITPPTEGQITLKGRVGSLLEVGTGFHPELTGRENIYLNGALLGMRRAEIAKNFDAIVEFAEIAEFLDTPVKRYSSGMYVRLAFAVAAHLQTEILIVDEVLAVGDSRFQKKCIDKMNEVGRAGRTVLFVSHNLALIESVCTHGLLLEHGRQKGFDKIEKIVEGYQVTGEATSETPGGVQDLTKLPRPKGRTAILESAQLTLEGENATLKVEAAVPKEFSNDLNLIARVCSDFGATLFTLNAFLQHGTLSAPSGKLSCQCRFALPPLREGRYTVALELTSRDTMIDEVPSAVNFVMTNDTPTPTHYGPLAVKGVWSVKA